MLFLLVFNIKIMIFPPQFVEISEINSLFCIKNVIFLSEMMIIQIQRFFLQILEIKIKIIDLINNNLGKVHHLLNI